MKKIFIFFIFTLQSILLIANNHQTDALLKELDRTIKKHSFYIEKKEQKIDSLKFLLKDIRNIEVRYDIYNKVFDEYSRYNLDSALSIAYEKRTLAEQLKNPEQYIYMSELNISEILGRMGMYKESLDILHSIQSKKLHDDEKAYYFHLNHSLYTLMEENSLSQKEKAHYQDVLLNYKDSLIQILPFDNITHATMRKGKLLEMGKYKEALQILDSCLTERKVDASEAGILNYELSDVYEKMGDYELQKKHLIIASINDLKRAVRSYIALRKLSTLLYKEGDIERANTYVRCAMEDAIACRARFRTLEISETLPIITASYDKKEEQDKERLIVYLVLISILSIVLTISVIYIWRQLKKLSATRRSLAIMYQDVKKLNKELSDFNKQLSESNLVKEEYIGTVFNLCSGYIDKMERYRIDINRKLKAGQTSDAIRATSSTTLVSTELKEFFQNFDAVFLNLYPNFIEDFNELLLEGEKIYPKNEDILSPELRVFALMRLGITDSSKLASFLHYSPQTIYNYKLKVKNKLAVSKEEFSQIIQINW